MNEWKGAFEWSFWRRPIVRLFNFCNLNDIQLYLNVMLMPHKPKANFQLFVIQSECEMDANKTSIKWNCFFYTIKEDWRVVGEKKKRKKMNFVLSMSIRMLNGNEFFSLQNVVCCLFVMCHPRRFEQKIYIEAKAKVEMKSQGESFKLSILKSVFSELN